MNEQINPNEYEIALAEKLLYEFPPPSFQILHDLKIEGVFSKGKRQIDVAVRRTGESFPFLVAEAKLHSNTLNIGQIEAFVTKLRDVKAQIGLLVVSSGFSKPGKRLADAFGIELGVLTIEEALETQWRPIARRIFPEDWAFHPRMATALYQLQKGAEPDNIIESIEDIPFDEWLALVQYALIKYPGEAIKFLYFVSLYHPDEGWRFNAVQQLIDASALTRSNVNRLVESERDPEILELLRSSGAT